MAIYEIEGKRFEIPDDVQGDKLVETLTFLSEQQKPEPTGFPGAGFFEPLGTIASSMIAEPAAGIAGLLNHFWLDFLPMVWQFGIAGLGGVVLFYTAWNAILTNKQS